MLRAAFFSHTRPIPATHVRGYSRSPGALFSHNRPFVHTLTHVCGVPPELDTQLFNVSSFYLLTLSSSPSPPSLPTLTTLANSLLLNLTGLRKILKKFDKRTHAFHKNHRPLTPRYIRSRLRRDRPLVTLVKRTAFNEAGE